MINQQLYIKKVGVTSINEAQVNIESCKNLYILLRYVKYFYFYIGKKDKNKEKKHKNKAGKKVKEKKEEKDDNKDEKTEHVQFEETPQILPQELPAQVNLFH